METVLVPFLINNALRQTHFILNALLKEENMVWCTLAGHGAKDPLSVWCACHFLCRQTVAGVHEQCMLHRLTFCSAFQFSSAFNTLQVEEIRFPSLVGEKGQN